MKEKLQALLLDFETHDQALDRAAKQMPELDHVLISGAVAYRRCADLLRAVLEDGD